MKLNEASTIVKVYIANLKQIGLCIIIDLLCSQAILWMICIVIISYEVLFCLFLFSDTITRL